MPAVGIDLGTTNSCVGVYRKNQIEIIINEQGNRVTPSFVSFTDTETLVGDAAKSEAPFNFKNTLFQMKRLIGRKYDDPVVQADMKLWGFSVINDDNTPKIPVMSDNGRQIFRPEEISAFVLKSLIKSAKLRLEEDITDAVITVPAYFNNAQRRATLDAGKLAGLNVVRMINEPTAAAIAYGLDTQETGEQKVLVFDLGGGTFDVTIVDINGCDIDVLATGGDTHLGGDDFDNRMVKHFVTEFKNKNESDMSDNKLGMNRLRVACEAAKRNLSSMTSTTVQVDGLHNGIHFRSKISRAKFEELNYDFFTKMMETVKNALSDANICKEDIDNIVLVGGSTRIPKVEGILKDFFKEVNISRTINPDEAVAYGAAALAAKISSGGSAQLDKLVLHDVTPLSLGWKDSTGEMQVVVKRNTKIPTKNTTTTRTAKDYQTNVCLEVYEGERLAAEDNHFLGSFSLYDIPPALKGVEEFEISFVLDENGILVVNERCLSTGEEKEMTIGNEGRLSVAEVASMIRKARLCSEKDEAWKKRRDQMHNLENFVYGVKHSLHDKKFKRNITDGDKEIIVEKCDEILEWIDAEENPEIHRSINKQKDLEKTCRPIFHKIPGGQDYLDKLKK